jgi:hypothetical protein
MGEFVYVCSMLRKAPGNMAVALTNSHTGFTFGNEKG